MVNEVWRPIPGYEGCYEASDLGRIRSLPRTVRFGNYQRRIKGRTRKPVNLGPYLAVNLSVDGKAKMRTVHQLVLEAFIGPRPHGQEACHNNGDPHDNRLENLRWDTKSANSYDALQHGAHPTGSKTHCPQGHAYSPGNTSLAAGTGYRLCKACRRERERVRYYRLRELTA